LNILIRFEHHPGVRIGGAERQMLLIAKYLKKKGMNFHYVINDPSRSGFKTEKFEEVKIETYGTKVPKSRFHPLNLFFDIFNKLDLVLLFKFFKNLDFDIYHLMGANPITGIWAFFSKIIKKKRFVYTIAGEKELIPGALPWNFLIYKIYKYALKRADLVIAIADYLKQQLYKTYSVESLVIRSGHPIPEGPFIKDDPPLILWISGLREIKNPEIFLSIVKKLENLDVQFLLIGPGNYKKEEIIKLEKNQKNFRFIAGVPKGVDNLYYRKASLLINTSSHEGYPNAFIQAWLHETPVVSLKVDPDGVIKKNKLGFHADGDLKKMITQIKQFINDPNSLRNLGKECRKFAIENHNIAKTARKHLKVYNMLNDRK